MNQIKHIFWDWNGTLLDDVDLCVSVTGGMLREKHGIELTRDDYLREFGFPVIDFYRKVGLELQDHEYADVANQWIQTYRDGLNESGALHSGVIDTLVQLNELGFKQSILSACEKNLLDHALDHYGITHHFHTVHGVSDNKADGKAALAKSAVTQTLHDSHECVLIGDTDHDYEVAHAAGIHCVLIAHGHQDKVRLEKTGATVLNNIRELIEFLND